MLPFASYRAPAWNDGQPVLDPAGRFFAADTVVNDDLVVSGRLIEGEDPRAAAVQDALTGIRDPADLPTRLGELGIGAVLVDDAAGPPGAPLDGLDVAWRADALAVYTVPAPVATPPEPSTGRRVAVGAAWAVAAGALIGAVAGFARRRLSPPRAGSVPP